jgi:hypothetical protein
MAWSGKIVPFIRETIETTREQGITNEGRKIVRDNIVNDIPHH